VPINPPTKPNDGDEVVISFFEDLYDENEVYLNSGIRTNSDFVTSSKGNEPVVKTRHIYKPDFYASGSNRTELVSSEVYYRNTPFGVENLSFHHPHAGSKTSDFATERNQTSGWVPVRNMGATFNVQENSTKSTVLCSFYAYEMGGSLSPWGSGVEDDDGDTPGKLEEAWCAEFALFVNGEIEPTTARYLYASTSFNHMHSRKQFSFICHPTLSAGINHVVVMCLVRSLADSPRGNGSSGTREVNSNEGFAMTEGTNTQSPTYNCPGWKHIMVGGRSMVIDVHAL
jgi:hypothetical protein